MNAAIGQVCRLVALSHVELLARVGLTHESRGFTGDGGINSRGRSSVGLTEERKLHSRRFLVWVNVSVNRISGFFVHSR